MAKLLTPLRYPGGKQKLSPFILDIINSNNVVGGHYVEPYAGGAGVAIDLLLSGKVSEVHLNDSDLGVYAFWYSILNHPDEFCKMILTASLTVEEWKYRKKIVKELNPERKLELGFSVFFLNRCNRSGILNGGLIGGLEQKGEYKMDARFSRNDLIRRVEAISNFSKNIHISNLDAEVYIKEYIPSLPKNSLIYLDPPYFFKGSNLYLNSYKKKDHERIAKIIQEEIKHFWVLSYDGVPEIVELYKNRRHFLYDLRYSADKNYMGKEIFIFSDNMNLPIRASVKSVQFGLNGLNLNNNISARSLDHIN